MLFSASLQFNSKQTANALCMFVTQRVLLPSLKNMHQDMMWRKYQEYFGQIKIPT